jgi:hypothetical protein
MTNNERMSNRECRMPQRHEVVIRESLFGIRHSELVIALSLLLVHFEQDILDGFKLAAGR